MSWRKFFGICFLLLILIVVAGGVFVTWGYFYITRDLPKLSTIDDYRPAAVSKVYASDGTLIGEYFYEERRYPAKLKEVPLFVRNAFLAAEDASFYSHPGIDFLSILRAFVRNIQTGSMRQGGSTITQQVVKNLLLTSEKKLERKVKEAILSYNLEKRFSKDEILEMYLNQIFFGSTAWGIKAAAHVYFHKELDELTLAEAAMLAGLPKAPSDYSPVLHFDAAKTRQAYVLAQMVEGRFISAEARDAALKEEIKVYKAVPATVFDAPYYVTEVRRYMKERWKDLDLDRGGLEIYTAVDLQATKMAQEAMRKGLREVDKRRGWRGPLKKGVLDKDAFLKEFASDISPVLAPNTVYPALVTSVSRRDKTVRVDLGHFTATIDLKKKAQWAQRLIDEHDNATWINLEEVIQSGNILEVALDDTPPPATPQLLPPGVRNDLALDQTPEIQGSLVLIDPHTGKVPVMVGGYSFQKSVFNRVTQAYRQPGSAFKPVVYLSAVDGFKYTPATIVYDQPRTFRVGDDFWTPQNYDESYSGPITLQTALEKSKNLVSADIVSQIGVPAIIRYAKLLGIESNLGQNLSLALGSSEVTMLELARAYGVLAAGGVLFDSVIVTKVLDRDGKAIFDHEEEKLGTAREVISENSVFVLTHMMKGVVERGTGTRVKPIGRPAAGKTGTSNDQMDAWFLGFTAKWVCGVWVGFDVKRTIGDKETGGRVAAPIWLYFMQEFLAMQDAKNYERLQEDAKLEAQRLGIEYVEPEKPEVEDFAVPEGVDPFLMDRRNGILAEEGDSNALLEYFIKGTAPRGRSEGADSTSYLDSPEL